MIRKLVQYLNEYLRGYLLPPPSVRRKICVPAKISIESDSKGLRNSETGKLVMRENSSALSTKCETRDLSENGLAFVVSSIRLGQNYLVGQAGKPLDVTLDLPSGKICFQAVGQRYEPLDEAASAAKYLIGAKITRISETDRRIYMEYLERGYKTSTDNKALSLGISNN
ncbi:MAG: PilZ domain-containing protein [Pyrinomonadaceae bacterium]